MTEEVKIEKIGEVNEEPVEVEAVDEPVEVKAVDEPVEMTEEKTNDPRPIIHIKLLNAATESFNDEASETFRQIASNLSEAGYFPIITSSNIDFVDAKPEDTIGIINGNSITIQDIINVRDGKYGTTEKVYTEKELVDAVALAAARIKQVDDFIDNINAKIQMIFPNTTEFYSMITLPEDYRAETAVTGRPPFSVQSNNPMFTTTLTSLIENNKDEAGNVDVLATLSAYLDKKIRENMEKDIRVIKRDENGNPVEKIVTPEEVAEGLKAKAEEE